jgi:hypothetical protein
LSPAEKRACYRELATYCLDRVTGRARRREGDLAAAVDVASIDIAEVVASGGKLDDALRPPA